jgi:hypothetical protein
VAPDGVSGDGGLSGATGIPGGWGPKDRNANAGACHFFGKSRCDGDHILFQLAAKASRPSPAPNDDALRGDDEWVGNSWPPTGRAPGTT